MLLATALAVILAARYVNDDLRIRLPPPLDVDGAAIDVPLRPATGTDGAPHGAFAQAVEEKPYRRLVWLDGADTVEVVLPPSAIADRGADRSPGDAVITLGARPDVAERRCVTVAVGVNEHDLPRFVPFIGWREYRLRDAADRP